MSNLNIEKVLKILQKNKLIYTLIGILLAFIILYITKNIILNTGLKEHFSNLKMEISNEKLSDLDGKIVDKKAELEKSDTKKDLYKLLDSGEEYLKYRILQSFIRIIETRPNNGFLPIDLQLWKFINDGDMKKLIDSLPGSGSSGSSSSSSSSGSGSGGGLF